MKFSFGRPIHFKYANCYPAISSLFLRRNFDYSLAIQKGPFSFDIWLLVWWALIDEMAPSSELAIRFCTILQPAFSSPLHMILSCILSSPLWSYHTMLEQFPPNDSRSRQSTS